MARLMQTSGVSRSVSYSAGQFREGNTAGPVPMRRMPSVDHKNPSQMSSLARHGMPVLDSGAGVADEVGRILHRVAGDHWLISILLEFVERQTDLTLRGMGRQGDAAT